MKSIAKLTVVTMAALALSACSGQNKQNKVASKNSDGIKITKVKHGNLTSKDMTPQKTVAIITAYAGQKYSSQWKTSLENAEDNGLTVKLADQSSYSYMEDGSGVAYMVGQNAGYTLKQSGSDITYYLYGDQKELASVKMDEMVSYLNQKNSDNLVKKLMNSAKIDDQRGNSDSSSSSDSASSNSSSSSNIPGDAGLFQIPANMQGTWYTWDDEDHKIVKTTFTQNKIIDDHVSELHKVQKDYWNHHDMDKMAKRYATKLKYIDRTIWIKNIHGMDWINVQGWFQDAGDGEYYAAHTEKGQPVIVEAAGAELWVNSVHWKTPQLAMQYKNKKFEDLYYQD